MPRLLRRPITLNSEQPPESSVNISTKNDVSTTEALASSSKPVNIDASTTEAPVPASKRRISLKRSLPSTASDDEIGASKNKLSSSDGNCVQNENKDGGEINVISPSRQKENKDKGEINAIPPPKISKRKLISFPTQEPSNDLQEESVKIDNKSETTSRKIKINIRDSNISVSDKTVVSTPENEITVLSEKSSAVRKITSKVTDKISLDSRESIKRGNETNLENKLVAKTLRESQKKSKISESDRDSDFGDFHVLDELLIEDADYMNLFSDELQSSQEVDSKTKEDDNDKKAKEEDDDDDIEIISAKIQNPGKTLKDNNTSKNKPENKTVHKDPLPIKKSGVQRTSITTNKQASNIQKSAPPVKPLQKKIVLTGEKETLQEKKDDIPTKQLEKVKEDRSKSKKFSNIVILGDIQYYEFMNKLSEFKECNVKMVVDKTLNAQTLTNIIRKRKQTVGGNSLWILASGIFSIADVINTPSCRTCESPIPQVKPQDEFLYNNHEHNVREIRGILNLANELCNNIQKELGSNDVIALIPPIPTAVVQDDVYHYHNHIHRASSINKAPTARKAHIELLSQVYEEFCKAWTTLAWTRLRYWVDASVLMSYVQRRKGNHLVVARNADRCSPYYDSLCDWSHSVKNFFSAIVQIPDSANLLPDPYRSISFHSDPYKEDSFDRVVILGNNELTIALQEATDTLPVIYVDEGCGFDFSEEGLNFLMDQQKIWPNKTLWVVLTGVSEIADIITEGPPHCSKLGCRSPIPVFVTKNNQLSNSKFKGIKDEDMIEKIVNQAFDFVDNASKHLGEGSALFLTPIMPLKAIYAGDTHTHTHEGLHRFFKDAPYIPLFIGESKKWISSAETLDKTWERRIRENCHEENELNHLINAYYEQKPKTLDFIDNVKNIDLIKLRENWSSFMFKVIKNLLGIGETFSHGASKQDNSNNEALLSTPNVPTVLDRNATFLQTACERPPRVNAPRPEVLSPSPPNLAVLNSGTNIQDQMKTLIFQNIETDMNYDQANRLLKTFGKLSSFQWPVNKDDKPANFLVAKYCNLDDANRSKRIISYLKVFGDKSVVKQVGGIVPGEHLESQDVEFLMNIHDILDKIKHEINEKKDQEKENLPAAAIKNLTVYTVNVENYTSLAPVQAINEMLIELGALDNGVLISDDCLQYKFQGNVGCLKLLQDFRFPDKKLKITFLEPRKVDESSKSEMEAAEWKVHLAATKLLDRIVKMCKANIEEEANLYTFKTRLCREGNSCSKKERCHFYHDKGDKRRSPFAQVYGADICPQMEDFGTCDAEDECYKCHSALEVKFHFRNYRSDICSDWNKLGFCDKAGKTCPSVHPDTADMFYHKKWNNLCIKDVNKAVTFLVGAVRNLFTFPSMKCLRVLFITPETHMVKFYINCVTDFAQSCDLTVGELDGTKKVIDTNIAIATPDAILEFLQGQVNRNPDLYKLKALIVDDFSTVWKNLPITKQNIFRDLIQMKSVNTVLLTDKVDSSVTRSYKIVAEQEGTKRKGQDESVVPVPEKKLCVSGSSQNDQTSKSKSELPKDAAVISSVQDKLSLVKKKEDPSLEAEEKLKNEIENELKLYIVEPEKHPRYRQKHAYFMGQYRLQYPGLCDMNRANGLFKRFWRGFIEAELRDKYKPKFGVKSQIELESFIKEINITDSNKVENQDKSSQGKVDKELPVSNISKSKNPLAKTLALYEKILENLTPALGLLGPALKLFIEKASSSLDNKDELNKLLQDEETQMVLKMMSEKFKKLSESDATSPLSSDLKLASSESLKLLKDSSQMPKEMEKKDMVASLKNKQQESKEKPKPEKAKDTKVNEKPIEVNKGKPNEKVTESKPKPKETKPTPKVIVAKPKEIMAKPKEIVAKPKEIVAKPKEIVVKPKEIVVKPKEKENELYGVDLQNIATSTYNKEPSYVIEYVKNALINSGSAEATTDVVTEVYVAVSKIHVAMCTRGIEKGNKTETFVGNSQGSSHKDNLRKGIDNKGNTGISMRNNQERDIENKRGNITNRSHEPTSTDRGGHMMQNTRGRGSENKRVGELKNTKDQPNKENNLQNTRDERNNSNRGRMDAENDGIKGRRDIENDGMRARRDIENDGMRPRRDIENDGMRARRDIENDGMRARRNVENRDGKNVISNRGREMENDRNNRNKKNIDENIRGFDGPNSKDRSDPISDRGGWNLENIGKLENTGNTVQEKNTRNRWQNNLESNKDEWNNRKSSEFVRDNDGPSKGGRDAKNIGGERSENSQGRGWDFNTIEAALKTVENNQTRLSKLDSDPSGRWNPENKREERNSQARGRWGERNNEVGVENMKGLDSEIKTTFDYSHGKRGWNTGNNTGRDVEKGKPRELESVQSVWKSQGNEERLDCNNRNNRDVFNVQSREDCIPRSRASEIDTTIKETGNIRNNSGWSTEIIASRMNRGWDENREKVLDNNQEQDARSREKGISNRGERNTGSDKKGWNAEGNVGTWNSGSNLGGWDARRGESGNASKRWEVGSENEAGNRRTDWNSGNRGGWNDGKKDDNYGNDGRILKPGRNTGELNTSNPAKDFGNRNEWRSSLADRSNQNRTEWKEGIKRGWDSESKEDKNSERWSSRNVESDEGRFSNQNANNSLNNDSKFAEPRNRNFNSFQTSSFKSNMKNDSLQGASFRTDMKNERFQSPSFRNDMKNDSFQSPSFRNDMKNDSFQSSSFRNDMKNDSFQSPSFRSNMKNDSLPSTSFRSDSLPSTSFRSDSFQSTPFRSDIKNDSFQSPSFRSDVKNDSFQSPSFRSDVKKDSFQSTSFRSDMKSERFQTSSFRSDVKRDSLQSSFRNDMKETNFTSSFKPNITGDHFNETSMFGSSNKDQEGKETITSFLTQNLQTEFGSNQRDDIRDKQNVHNNHYADNDTYGSKSNYYTSRGMNSKEYGNKSDANSPHVSDIAKNLDTYQDKSDSQNYSKDDYSAQYNRGSDNFSSQYRRGTNDDQYSRGTDNSNSQNYRKNNYNSQNYLNTSDNLDVQNSKKADNSNNQYSQSWSDDFNTQSYSKSTGSSNNQNYPTEPSNSNAQNYSRRAGSSNTENYSRGGSSSNTQNYSKGTGNFNTQTYTKKTGYSTTQDYSKGADNSNSQNYSGQMGNFNTQDYSRVSGNYDNQNYSKGDSSYTQNFSERDDRADDTEKQDESLPMDMGASNFAKWYM